MAALTFRRHPYNHTFRIESSCFRWNFNFTTQRRLICRLSRVDMQKIQRERRAVRDQARTTRSRIWEDVSVIIGAPRKICTSEGGSTKGNKISLREFREWLNTTIDIEAPDPKLVYRTSSGDLIIDPQYSGKLYLQGLLLPHGSTTGKPLRYAYNFLEGKTGRDRESLAGSGQEARQVTAIWAAALRETGPSSTLISAYTEPILGYLNEVADVMLDVHGQHLDQDIAEMVWKEMRCINEDNEGRLPFYYSPSETQNVGFIFPPTVFFHCFSTRTSTLFDAISGSIQYQFRALSGKYCASISFAERPSKNSKLVSPKQKLLIFLLISLRLTLIGC